MYYKIIGNIGISATCKWPTLDRKPCALDHQTLPLRNSVQVQLSKAPGGMDKQKRDDTTQVFFKYRRVSASQAHCSSLKAWLFFHSGNREIKKKGGVQCKMQLVPDT